MEKERKFLQCASQVVKASRQARLTLVAAIALTILTPLAQAQTYTVIHNFTGPGDGQTPLGRLSIDRAGNLYGGTYSGGTKDSGGWGIVFKMSPRGSNWTFAPLFTFTAQTDTEPGNGVLFGPDGSLWGTSSNLGNVFNLKPSPNRPASVLSPWNINWLFEFPFPTWPSGDVLFDSQGNIYGSTYTGGNHGCFNNEGCGMVYELTPSAGGWTQTPLYIFQGGADGEGPNGISWDSDGNLIGTAGQGGAHFDGIIFKLTRSGNSWNKSTLYDFDCSGSDGCVPETGLTPDGAGNFYGSTVGSNSYSGVIFEFSPSNGGWIYTKLVQIPPKYQFGPNAPLTMDGAGNFYGTIGTRNSNQIPGAVFKLAYGSGGWTFTSLHDFTEGDDGGSPASTVVMDANGNLYGTAVYGGANCHPIGCGVVWEITP